MSTDRMRDLTITPLDGGGFELSQGGWPDAPDVIELHPCQIHLLAERAGLLPAPDAKLLDRLGAAHARRLHALRDRIRHLDDLYRDEIVERCGSGVEIGLHLEAISDLVYDLIDGIGTVEPDRGAEVPAESNDKSAAISVTPEHPKRGRPATGAALTNAERQSRYREKQIDLLDEPERQVSAATAEAGR